MRRAEGLRRAEARLGEERVILFHDIERPNSLSVKIGLGRRQHLLLNAFEMHGMRLRRSHALTQALKIHLAAAAPGMAFHRAMRRAVLPHRKRLLTAVLLVTGGTGLAAPTTLRIVLVVIIPVWILSEGLSLHDRRQVQRAARQDYRRFLTEVHVFVRTGRIL